MSFHTINKSQPQNEEDKFTVVMKDVIEEAKKEHIILQQLFEEAENQNDILAEFYVFDKKKYDLKNLFIDLKIFKDDFIVS